MALAPTGVIARRSGGIGAAIAKQVKSVNLKPVKKIFYTFDPFGESQSLRDLMFHLSVPNVKQTNLNVISRHEVLSNRQEPTVDVTLLNGESVLFKCGNLTTLELLTLFNKHISVLAPKEDADADDLSAKYTKKLAKKQKLK